jgi:2-hydroxycyclohexanecarboxyl-CoA dehydrogenase
VAESDVADLQAVTRMVARTEAELGPITILVNNAGVGSGGAGSLEAFDAAQMARMRAVNADSVIHTVRAVAPGMKARGYGRIVNIASDASRVGSTGEAVYSAAKGGVVAFSKSLARELARAGVTVNVVSPGPADTPMLGAIRATEFGGKVVDRIIAASPRRRLASPDEIAAAVAYFIRDDAAFVTGQILSVSGGLTMAG